jgi:hypothetical protein
MYALSFYNTFSKGYLKMKIDVVAVVKRQHKENTFNDEGTDDEQVHVTRHYRN